MNPVNDPLILGGSAALEAIKPSAAASLTTLQAARGFLLRVVRGVFSMVAGSLDLRR